MPEITFLCLIRTAFLKTSIQDARDSEAAPRSTWGKRYSTIVALSGSSVSPVTHLIVLEAPALFQLAYLRIGHS
jgi:hypothetical protein